ncbi:hypothetical protein G9A89_021093 [Geosiphon pyriformis]|nr:hypothetical protein G9A89_021093 [Geosiphon pyriformis]
MTENQLAGLVKFANADGILIADQFHKLLFGWCNTCSQTAGNNIAVLNVLSFEFYLNIVKSLKKYSVVFVNQLLDHHVLVWFAFLVKFIIENGLLNSVMLSSCSIPTNSLCDFGYIGECLLNSRLGFITIYIDGSVKNLGFLSACGGATAYFPNVDVSVKIKVDGLLSSTLVEMRAIAFALKCVSAS